MDRIGVEFRRRGDGVVPGLEAGNGGDDAVEGDRPRGVGGRGGVDGEGISSGENEHFGQFEALYPNLVVVERLVGPQSLQESASRVRRSEFGERTDGLSRSDGGNVEVVAENGVVRRRDGEGDLGESGIKGNDVDGLITLRFESQDAKESLHFGIGIEGPNSDVIPRLVT